MAIEYTTYRFDDVLVETDSFRISKSGQVIPLEPKAFELLLFLLERPGRLVSKEELLDHVWNKSFVTPNAMTRVIAQLRKALNDTRRDPRYIQTIQTRGYRFVAKVTQTTTAAKIENSLPYVSKPFVSPIIESLSPIQSLAVLPLDNLSGDTMQEYFVDGLTDELIAEISMTGRLRVISRTSSMCYKRSPKSLPEIAQELNVDAILEGSVLRAGDRVRVTVQLIRAAHDEHLWAKSYEQTITDVFASQRTLARSIAEEVKRCLSSADIHRQRPSSEPFLHATPSQIPTQAIENYLQGIYLFHQERDRLPASRKAIKKSISYFEAAIELAPSYAQAYSAMANAHRWLAAYGEVEHYPVVETLAKRAIALDETLDEAHASLAYTLMKYHWDWAGAERGFKRAIEIRANTPFRNGYAMLLCMRGRHDLAIAEVKLAEQYEPLNLTFRVVAGLLFAYAGRHAEATEQLRNAAALKNNISTIHWATGVAYQHAKRLDEATAAFQKARDISPESLFAIGDLAYALATAGNRDQALQLLQEMHDSSQYKRVPPHSFALAHAGLGNIESALEWLERACNERSDFVTYLKVDRRLDGLRHEPQFESLLTRVGLSDCRAHTDSNNHHRAKSA